MKKCTKCGIEKPLVDFSKHPQGKGGLRARCKRCESEYHKIYYANKDNWERHRIQVKSNHEKHKDEVFAAYGNRCSCCGETIRDFLTIDHVQSDGYKDRYSSGNRISGSVLYKRIKKEGFPQDRYTLLCWNCNSGRAIRGNGICPHQQEETIIDIYIRENSEMQKAL